MAASDAGADALRGVMQSGRNRHLLARLEDALEAFLASDKTELEFPPRSDAHRRVCYAVAHRFGLDHRLEDRDGVCLVLLKTPRSAVPPTRLASEHHEADAPSENPLCAPRAATFLRRPASNDSRPARAANAPAAASARAVCKISEEEYELARARIFKGAQDGVAPTLQMSNTPVVVGGGIAQGPVPGSVGFARRRAASGVSAAATSEAEGDATREAAAQACPPQEDVARAFPPRRSASSPGLTEGRAESLLPAPVSGGPGTSSPNIPSGGPAGLQPAPPAQHSANGRQSVGVGNGTGSSRGHNDRQDPDFDRRYDKWAVRRAPPLQPRQQIPAAVFGQLLYPYSSHAPPVMHQHAMPMQSVGVHGAGPHQHQHQQQQIRQPQLPSVLVHRMPPQPPVMHGHGGQLFGAMPSLFPPQHTPPQQHVHPSQASLHPSYMPPYSDGLTAAASVPLQRHLTTATPPPVVTPTYGLDSTADFPPLS